MIIKAIDTTDEINGKAYVHSHAWKEAYEGLVDTAFLDSWNESVTRERALRAIENGVTTFLAKDDARVVGFADCGAYRGGDLKNTGEIYAIYILKEYYGKGLGSALMLEALAALNEYRKIAVWVLEGNERATRFYVRHGFHFDGKTKAVPLGEQTTIARMVLTR